MPNRTLYIKTMLLLVPLALILLACHASGPPASKPTSTPYPTSTFSLPTPPPVSPDLVASLEESTTDILGLHETSEEYQEAMDAGLRVVNVPELGSFFGIWIPDGYDQQEVPRVMAVVPGTNGVVYKSMELRIGHAQAHGYTLVIVQWWKGKGEDYLAPSVVYSLLATGLEYVRAEYGADVDKAAYEGFSRGSAIAWEIAYWDRVLGSDYFDLFICHSGGMRDPGPPFNQGLRAGAWGDDVYERQRFYMYCGMKDREPKMVGTPRCEWMHDAEQSVIEYGGTIERFIEDPDGGHADFLLTEGYYEDALEVWFELTE